MATALPVLTDLVDDYPRPDAATHKTAMTAFRAHVDEMSKQSADVASDATVDLDAMTGHYGHITGTTAITAITLSEGHERTVVFDGALTLTYGSSLLTLTGANITTEAGDIAVFRGEASGVVRMVGYMRASGAPLTFLDEDDMTSDSATAVPSQQSVKAYVDNKVGVRIVSAYSNGTDWYREWSDGWVEQGGYITTTTTLNQTFNFLVEFAGTNYSLDISAAQSTNAIPRISVYSSSQFVASAINYQSSVAAISAFWRAAGFKA